jgi:hypothetical protein
VDAPTDVLVADLANGCQAFVKWTAPAGTPQGYNVYMAKGSVSATYNKKNYTTVTDTLFTIPNLNLADNIFVKVSAIDENGVETALSAAGEDAQIDSTISAVMSAEARLGDIIVAEAYFTGRVTGGVIAFQVPSEFTFDGIVTLFEFDDDNYVLFSTDRIIFVLGGQTVAEVDQKGWYLRGYKTVLNDLGPPTWEGTTTAPWEWDASQGILWMVHITPTSVRLLGIDVNGNMYLPEHDAQPMQLGASSLYGCIESGNELQFCNGFYQISAIDRDALQLWVRGRIIENFSF